MTKTTDTKIIVIAIVCIALLIGLFLLFKQPAATPEIKSTTEIKGNSFFENSSNYKDTGNVTERFAHYISTSRHTAKSDILDNPMFFNGYKVIIAGEYEERELYGEHLGVLTDSADNTLVLVHKDDLFNQSEVYEVTGVVRVVEYESKNIPLIWVEQATIYGLNVSTVNITNITNPLT
jgi:hypothetical protein